MRGTTWREYALRFVLGGAITAVAGLIARRYGPIPGGIFLAFPAIFPASATLVEKHESEKKLRAGIEHTTSGRKAAALDARGAWMGSAGLILFAFTAWKLLPMSPPAAGLPLSLIVWLAVSVLAWRARRLRFGRRRA